MKTLKIDTTQWVKPKVISGGPCGGKSSIIPGLVETLLERGYDVYPIPEMATHLESLGIHPKYGISPIDFQKQILKTQLFHEQLAQYQIKQKNNLKNSVILCDRGLVDNMAYIERPTYQELLKPYRLDIEQVFSRYDGAVLLQTAAYGAEEFYTNENKARRETPQQAREKDDQTKKVYNEFHGPQHFISNTNPTTGERLTFAAKKNNAKNALLSLLGDPPIQYERQFDVSACDRNELMSYDTIQLDIAQYYLPVTLFDRPGFDEAKIRRMKKAGSDTSYYFLTLKKQQGDQRIKEEKVITKEQFDAYFPKRLLEKSIFKERYKFRNPEDNHLYKLDNFLDEKAQEIGKYRLEVELPNKEDFDIKLPRCIKKSKETTGDPKHLNINMQVGV